MGAFKIGQRGRLLEDLNEKGVKLSDIGRKLVKEARREKPKLGVLPKYLWLEDRANDIEDAIERRIEAKQEVPEDWIMELLNLTRSAVYESIKFRWNNN